MCNTFSKVKNVPFLSLTKRVNEVKERCYQEQSSESDEKKPTIFYLIQRGYVLKHK